MKFFTFCLLISGFQTLQSQSLVQNVRGRIIDAETKDPLIGAEIYLVGSNPLIGTISDLDGNFILEKIPVGRQIIQGNYLGYQSIIRDNILINSAHEYYLELELLPGIELTEVVIQAYSRKQPVNEQIISSHRRLDPEELQFHAATANDPGRLVMGFPGVQPSRDSRSDIIIRGNSSAGILWRLEGLDIPNPNHFARRGSSGGGITIFSASLLGSSDFMTGAFPSEYGNAYAGVFDMKFRHGNLFKNAQTIRAGILGLDIASEGPITKGKTSYLANFRYSTLGILNAAGIHLVGPRTDNNFQDLSFKIFHKGNKSYFSLWGMGGNSREDFRPNDLPWSTYSDYTSHKFTTLTGVVGATYNQIIDDNSYIQVNAGFMGQDILFRNDTLNSLEERTVINDENYYSSRLTSHAFYKRNFNSKLNAKFGIIATKLFYQMSHSKWNRSTGNFETLIQSDSDNNATLQDSFGIPHQFQSYFQFSYKPALKWTIHGGIHFLSATITQNNNSVDPRMGIQYTLSDKSSLNFSLGIFSSLPPPGSYYYLEQGRYVNSYLSFIKSRQIVLGFQQGLGKTLNLQIEAYAQYLWDVPVGNNPNEIYWSLNDVQGFANQPLLSTGTGLNRGIEITLEKFFSKGVFFVFGTSIFNSTFKIPSNTMSFNTQYNSQIATNFTGGKTWAISENTFIEAGLRLIYNSGHPITPVLSAYKELDGDKPVLDGNNPFSERVSYYFRPDLRLALRKNLNKSAYWLALDVQNFINRRNEDFIDYEFNAVQRNWEHRLQSPLTPLLTFQIDF